MTELQQQVFQAVEDWIVGQDRPVGSSKVWRQIEESAPHLRGVVLDNLQRAVWGELKDSRRTRRLHGPGGRVSWELSPYWRG